MRVEVVLRIDGQKKLTEVSLGSVSECEDDDETTAKILDRVSFRSVKDKLGELRSCVKAES